MPQYELFEHFNKNEYEVTSASNADVKLNIHGVEVQVRYVDYPHDVEIEIVSKGATSDFSAKYNIPMGNYGIACKANQIAERLLLIKGYLKHKS